MGGCCHVKGAVWVLVKSVGSQGGGGFSDKASVETGVTVCGGLHLVIRHGNMIFC